MKREKEGGRVGGRGRERQSHRVTETQGYRDIDRYRDTEGQRYRDI